MPEKLNLDLAPGSSLSTGIEEEDVLDDMTSWDQVPYLGPTLHGTLLLNLVCSNRTCLAMMHRAVHFQC